MELFDSHTHLMDKKFEGEVDNIIENAKNNNVNYMVNIGYDFETSKKAVEVAEKYDDIYATVGIHPEHCNEDTIDTSFIIEMAKSKKVVAIGEIGLDYHYDNTNKENQKKHFIELIKIANQLKLPVAIHSRDADMDMLKILKNNKIEKGFIMHCFSSSVEVAKEVLKLGGYISFAGTITFKNAKSLTEVAKIVPLDKILIETDAPFLSPGEYRGSENQPKLVLVTADVLANKLCMDINEFLDLTTKNAERLFKI